MNDVTELKLLQGHHFQSWVTADLTSDFSISENKHRFCRAPKGNPYMKYGQDPRDEELTKNDKNCSDDIELTFTVLTSCS